MVSFKNDTRFIAFMTTRMKLLKQKGLVRIIDLTDKYKSFREH